MSKSKTRIFSIFMAVVMMMTLAVPAVAASNEGALGEITIVDANGIEKVVGSDVVPFAANRTSMVEMAAAPAIDYGGGQVGVYTDLTTSTYVGSNMYVTHKIPQSIMDVLPGVPSVENGFTGWYVQVTYSNDGSPSSMSFELDGVSQGSGAGGAGTFTVSYYVPHFLGTSTLSILGNFSTHTSACYAHLKTI